MFWDGMTSVSVLGEQTSLAKLNAMLGKCDLSQGRYTVRAKKVGQLFDYALEKFKPG